MNTDRFTDGNRNHKKSLRGEMVYPDVYKKFFQARNIVLRGHNVLTWGSDMSHGISSLRIKQKIPTKIYCGANINTSGKVTFGTMEGYFSSDMLFKDDPLPIFSDEGAKNISLFLESFLVRNKSTIGVHIDFLSEIPSGHGFASSATISVLLTYLMYILIGKLELNILRSQELSLHQSLQEEIYDLSLQLSNCISGGRSIGASNYAVMSEGISLPIVHFSQKSDHTEKHGGNIMNEENTDIHIPIHRTLYKDSLMNFLGHGGQTSGELPIDYGVLFTGFPYRFGDITATRFHERLEKKSGISKIQKMILHLPDIQEAERSLLLGSFVDYENQSLSRDIDEINIKILDALRHLLDVQGSDSAVGKYIETLQKVGLLSFSAQKQNKLFVSLQYLFYRYREFEDEEIAILPFNSGKIGGSLLFVMRKGRSQQTLQKALEALKSDGYKTSLDYASWVDGAASEGVVLEQYISEKIFSSYTKEGDVLFSNTAGVTYSGEYDTIIKNETKGILLDTIGGRIYINGVKLTSKNIHSQNTTIDMLRILIEHIGTEVSNKKLPVSSYSQNKNEILGKVILPIKKLALQHFSVELSLSCSGGITEYYLRLDKDIEIPIGIIRKLSH